MGPLRALAAMAGRIQSNTPKQDKPDSVESLPEGWTVARIGEAFDHWGGMTPSKSNPNYWGGTTPWVSSKDIKGRRINGGTHVVTEDALRHTRLRVCDPGTVLVVVRSGVLVHSLPVAITDKPVVINQDLKALDSGEPVLNEWLAGVLRGRERVILEANRKDGTTVQSIRVDDLLDMEVPIAPVAEQRRIIALLESTLAKLDACRDRLERVPEILARFRQSVLIAACSGRLTEDFRASNPPLPSLNKPTASIRTRRGVPKYVEAPDEIKALQLPSSWNLQSCAELLRRGALVDVKDGNHGANHPKSAELGSTGLPFITAAQVRRAGIDYEGAPKVDGVALARLNVGFAQVDDVILTHKGSVGRVAVNTRQCVLTPQTTYYRCNADSFDPMYVRYFFESLYFYRQLAAVMSQTTRDFVPISEQYLLFFLVPPLEEQHEIVRRVGKLLELEDAIVRRVQNAIERAALLPQAVVQKAFRGELVPTEAELAAKEGRTYETAGELLRRVARVERAGGRRTNAGSQSVGTRSRKGRAHD